MYLSSFFVYLNSVANNTLWFPEADMLRDEMDVCSCITTVKYYENIFIVFVLADRSPSNIWGPELQKDSIRVRYLCLSDIYPGLTAMVNRQSLITMGSLHASEKWCWPTLKTHQRRNQYKGHGHITPKKKMTTTTRMMMIAHPLTLRRACGGIPCRRPGKLQRRTSAPESLDFPRSSMTYGIFRLWIMARNVGEPFSKVGIIELGANSLFRYLHGI